MQLPLACIPLCQSRSRSNLFIMSGGFLWQWRRSDWFGLGDTRNDGCVAQNRPPSWPRCGSNRYKSQFRGHCLDLHLQSAGVLKRRTRFTETLPAEPGELGGSILGKFGRIFGKSARCWTGSHSRYRVWASYLARTPGNAVGNLHLWR